MLIIFSLQITLFYEMYNVLTGM